MVINFKLLVVTLFSLFSCSQRQQLNNEKQYLVKIEKVSNSNAIESLGYYLIQTNDYEIDSLKTSNKVYNINSIMGEIVTGRKGIPILDYPIKFWEQSCENKKLILPQDLINLTAKDSLQLSRVYNELTNSSNYSMLELKTYKSIKYKLFIGFAEIENKDICLINWTHRISDTTAVLGSKFRLKN